MDEAEVAKQVSPEMEQMATQRARYRAKAAMWDLDTALFFFAIMTIVIILSFQGIEVEVVAPVAMFGLAMGWVMGWKKGKQAYRLFYDEELSKLEQELRKTVKGAVEETIEEKVKEAMRKRWESWR